MKSKQLFQILVLLALLFSPFGSSQSAHASQDRLEQADIIIVDRNLLDWNASFGFAAPTIYDNWHFTLTVSQHLKMTADQVTGDLIPLLVLLDVNGSELLRGTGTLTSDLSAGDYSIQIQPQTGMGIYLLAIQSVIPGNPTTTITVNPSAVTI